MRCRGFRIFDEGLVGVAAWVVVVVAASVAILSAEVASADGQTRGAALLKGEGLDPEVRLIASSESRILFEVHVPEYALSTHRASGETYDVVSIPGWGLTQQAGAPQVPTRGIMVGIPAGADVELRIVEAPGYEVGPYRILPAPERILLYEPGDKLDAGGVPPRIEQWFAESPSVYRADAFYPDEVARLAGEGLLRSQRFVTVQLTPIQYNPATGKLRLHTRVRIELSLSYPAGLQSSQLAAPVPESPAYERLLEDWLLNYASAKEWRVEPASQGIDATWPLKSTAYKIAVVQDGIYRLGYQDLEQAGIQMDTLDPQTIQIFSKGKEVSTRVVGEEDGEFNPSDYVLFYGQGVESKYTDRNVYWLVHGQGPGRRMPTRDGIASGPTTPSILFSAEVGFEEDLAYMQLWPGDDSTERWYWELVRAPDSVTMEIDLGQVSTVPMSSLLRVFMKGETDILGVDPDHHVEVYINNEPVGEHWWNGNDEIQMAEIAFDQSLLSSGTNTVRFSLPGDTGAVYDYVYLDRYEISYGHAYHTDSDQLEFTELHSGDWEYEIAGFTGAGVEVYDISEPLTITQIVSLEVDAALPHTLRFSDSVPATRTYLALTPDRWLSPMIARDIPSDLRSDSAGADYIIISHADFIPAAHRLAAHRAGQGLRTSVVDVQDVYDEFGYGLSLPHAIREFVKYAYESWQTTYVVLLGDGTLDPKNHADQGFVSYITPYLAFVDTWKEETPTDNWFVTVTTGTDKLPDLFLGRMPANTLAEADVMVSKTISYEASVPEADWVGQFVFVADRQPDTAGYFHNLSEALVAEYVFPPYDVRRVYLGNNPYQAPMSTCASGGECRQQLVEAINEGAWLVNYIGHGAPQFWGSGILDLGTIGLLTNIDRLPVMLPMTCYEGHFAFPYPGRSGISESIVRAEDGGAVASWGPTGAGVVYGHDELNRGFLEAVLYGGIREFGQATYAGKLRLYETDLNSEQFQTYTVFGDPALRLHVPPADLQVEKQADLSEQVLPGDVVTFTLAFSNTGPNIAFEPVLTDLIPGLLVNPTVIYSSAEVLSQREGITFAWTITDLWPHTGGQVVIRAQVDPNAEAPIAFFNEARITSSTPDLAPANNRATAGVGTESVYLPLILRNR